MTLSLDSLIATAQAQVQAKTALGKVETKARTAPTAPERKAALDEALVLRATLDWHSTALVFRWEEWTCTCGQSGGTPIGLFILEEHARMANSTRLRPPRSESGDAYPDLPRRVMRDTRPVPFCPECASTHGFVKPHAPRLPPPYAIRRVEGEFVQEWKLLTAPLKENEE